MFHFAGGVGLGVNVRDFLEFERAFECNGIVEVASQKQERIGAQEFLRAGAHVTGLFEDAFHLLWDGAQSAQEALCCGDVDGVSSPGKVNCEQGEGCQLCGECLGGGDADFRVGARVEGCVGGARDTRIHDVADCQNFCSVLARQFEACVGVGGFATLADGDESVVGGDDRLSISIFAGDVDIYGDASVLFDEVFSEQSRMIARSACDDLQASARFEMEFFDVFIQVDLAFGFEHTAAEGIGDFLRLFVNFFEHVVRVALFFGGGDVPFDRLDFAFDVFTGQIGDDDRGSADLCDVAVFEEDGLSGVCEDGREVACGKIFAFADGDEQWTLISCGDEFVGKIRAQRDDRIGTAHAAQCHADGACKIMRGVVTVRNEVGDDFGIGFGYELVSVRSEFFAQVEKVFDDSVVYDCEFSKALWVCIGLAGATVGCPACVADACSSAHGVVFESFDEVFEFSMGPAAVDVAFMTDRDSGRIVSTVGESAQTGQKDGHAVARADISDNSTHDVVVLQVCGRSSGNGKILCSTNGALRGVPARGVGAWGARREAARPSASGGRPPTRVSVGGTGRWHGG